MATFVLGHARPKGSLSPQIVRGGDGQATGRVRQVESSKDGPRWRRIMARAFREVRGDAAPFDGAVIVSTEFWFDYPSQAARELPWPIHPYIGDIDKLVRNVLDALTDAQVYLDDRQVVDLGQTRKMWVPDHMIGAQAGVGVSVWRV